MPVRRSVSVATRIAFCLLTLGFVALAGAGATYVGMELQAARVVELTRTAEGPLLVERLRAGVYAVVMESRGLYFARSADQATGFAGRLRGHLAEIETDWRLLHNLLPADERAKTVELDGGMAHFVELRAELARIGVEQGTQAADALGNNAANRSAREAFSKSLDELARSTSDTVKQQQDATVAAGRRLALVLLAATTGAATGVLGLALWLMRRWVSQPLRRVADALGMMAEGRLDGVTLPPAGSDEVGNIARAARVFLEKLVRNRELEAAAKAERMMRDRQAAAMERHTRDFNQSVSAAMTLLGASTESMRQAAAEMAHAVDQTHQGAAGTAAGAEESARNLTAVASATEELTASGGEIIRQVAQATKAAGDAVVRTAATDKTVRGLSEAAGHVGDVMRLIADIAAQTNLLALNATIEAARAGEAGKGFAVVASEVKQLAQQTARATEEIGKQVLAIQTSTGEAVEAVRGVGEAIMQVDTIASAIAASVGEQGAATREISGNVQAVAYQNTKATDSMRDVSDVARGASGSSEAVRIAATEVARVADTLRQEVDEFLTAMASVDKDKRCYERIPGRGARAMLKLGDKPEVAVELSDIACGGAALLCGLMPAAGSPVMIGLPGAAGQVAGRVVRSGGGIIAVVFQQDAVSSGRVDQSMEFFGAKAAIMKDAA